MRADNRPKIDFLYTNIGRGHPHYLDGIIECLSEGRVGRVTDVLSASDGIARLAWSTVRRVYRLGGRGGTLSDYNRLRSHTDYKRRSMALNVLGRGVTRQMAEDVNPLVVAHPMLAVMFRDRQTVVYQHGELAAPTEAWVSGPQKIVVPTQDTADVFLDAGTAGERLFVSGLCIEPGLVAKAGTAFSGRIDRLSGTNQLCGAFFSSGAEPKVHVESIVAAARSVHEREGRAIVFAKLRGTLEKRLRAACSSAGIELETADSATDIQKSDGRILLCPFTNRKELNATTAKLFPEFDYFVAPAHERANWALGLGLPMYFVDPPLGSFAPLNREILLNAGVAKPIRNRGNAREFAEQLETHHRSGKLCKMAEAGWQRIDIRGFANIAAMLESEY